MDFSDWFLQGQKDCEAGKESKPDMPEAYYRGYGTQYELEQIKTEMSEREYAR